MALTDEVTTRIGAQRLKELTNPNLPSATSVDTTRLAAAANDAIGEFESRTGQTFDLDNKGYVAACVTGTVCYLQKRMGNALSTEIPACVEWEKVLSDPTTGLAAAKIAPATSSVLTPTSEQPSGTTTVRPYFDHPTWDDLRPSPP